MRYIISSVLMFLFFVQWAKIDSSYAKNKNETRKIIELKRQGWKVFEKQSKIEKRPGIKPYEKLVRIVQVIKYKLNKDNKVVFCIVEYDSQLDRIIDACDSVAENIKIPF